LISFVDWSGYILFIFFAFAKVFNSISKNLTPPKDGAACAQFESQVMWSCIRRVLIEWVV
jgi:hypothetical protein